MNDACTFLRDWWRGYTEADYASVVAKMRIPRAPGELVELSPGEMTALVKGKFPVMTVPAMRDTA